jgi:preprotein translocase SecE subunit
MTQVQPRKIGIGHGTSFLSESVAELKKVTFPTRQQTIQAALVTVFIVMFVSLTLFILDIIFGQLMRAILT